MRVIQTPEAPEAIGPYAQAIRSGNYLFTSGQIPLTPEGQLIDRSIEEQTKQVLQNVRAVLQAAGSDLDRVIKTTVYLADMNDFSQMNDVYATFFEPHRPARSCVEVARLPKDVRVEIEVIAVVDPTV